MLQMKWLITNGPKPNNRLCSTVDGPRNGHGKPVDAVKLSTWSIKTTLLEDQILIIGVDVTHEIISLNRDLGSQKAVMFDSKETHPQVTWSYSCQLPRVT